MSKELAMGLGIAGVAVAGFFIKRGLQKRAINKAQNDPKLVEAVVKAAALDARVTERGTSLSDPIETLAIHAFDRRFKEALPCHFDLAWANGTGYFNNAVKKPMDVGSVYKTFDDTGRRLLLIGTEHGTVVLFDRYTPGQGPSVIVSNTPRELRDLIPNGALDAESLDEIFDTLIDTVNQ